MIDKLSQKEMEMVLNGEDINISLPGELGEHYHEKNWQELESKEQMLVRKWIRVMFSKSRNINRQRTSYGLKHYCESDVGFYVHNDVIKKAFLLEGYRAETGTINWFFNANGRITADTSKRFKNIFKEELNEYRRK